MWKHLWLWKYFTPNRVHHGLIHRNLLKFPNTTQKIKFSIEHLFSKCDIYERNPSLTCKLFIKTFVHNFFLGQFIWSVNHIVCDDPEILGKNYNIERNKARVSKRGQREKYSLILWLPWQNSYIQRRIHDSGKHLEWRALQQ